MMRAMKINLHERMFSELERNFVTSKDFTVSLLRYPNGVCTARLDNGVIQLEVLPFQGQQIWRFETPSRSLTMHSIFEQPENTTRFGLNYGAFLIHCGLTANGNPSPEDSHPLHGELPNCAYQSAYLSSGEQDGRPYLGLGGCFTYRNSLEYHYTFEPELRMFADSGVVEININASNLRTKAMPYMYMAHINWLPEDGSRLISSADPQSVQIFNDTFGLPDGDQAQFRQYVKAVEKDPSIADVIDPASQVYDPEFCMYMRCRPDALGYAHAMQVFPAGDAAYVSFRTRELPNAVRWYARTGDEDALAFAIPATNDHLGFARNAARGLIREIPAHSSLEMIYRFGYLPAAQAQIVEQTIRSIV